MDMPREKKEFNPNPLEIHQNMHKIGERRNKKYRRLFLKMSTLKTKSEYARLGGPMGGLGIRRVKKAAPKPRKQVPLAIRAWPPSSKSFFCFDGQAH